LKSLTLEIKSVPIKDSPLQFQYFLLSPKAIKGESHGLVMIPHGGPHSVYDTNFEGIRAFLALLGYHVLFVNFRGSSGFGLDFLNSLLGHCGEYDIADCMSALTDVLETHPTQVDKNRIVYYGGSHGGFIGGHLIARDERIKVGVLYNPVTNISSMVTITDIPDWCYVETGAVGISAESIKKMYEVSPIFYVEKMKIPTLFIIGNEDLRVPPSQSIHLHYLLKERGVPTKALIYPEQGHRIEKSEYASDLWINVALWYQQHLSPK